VAYPKVEMKAPHLWHNNINSNHNNIINNININKWVKQMELASSIVDDLTASVSF
jgi:hypothetical protein